MLKPLTKQDKMINMLLKYQTGFTCDADLRVKEANEPEAGYIMNLTVEECLMNYNMKEWEV